MGAIWSQRGCLRISKGQGLVERDEIFYSCIICLPPLYFNIEI